jgi:hypothetical protein
MKFHYLDEDQVGCCNCDKYKRAYIIYWYYSSPYCVDCWVNMIDFYSNRMKLVIEQAMRERGLNNV